MAQNWTNDVYAGTHVAATDMQNIENNFACLKGLFSGASAPANPVAGMPWLDTTAHLLKIRNEANSAWISLLDLANGRVPQATAAVAAVSATSATTAATATDALALEGQTLAEVLAAALPAYVAGSYIEGSAGPMDGAYGGAEYYKSLEIKMGVRGGTVTTKLTINTVLFSYPAPHARIYVNGSPVGTERIGATIAAGSVNFTEDITVAAGDLVQVYSWGGAEFTVQLDIMSGNSILPQDSGYRI